MSERERSAPRGLEPLIRDLDAADLVAIRSMDESGRSVVATQRGGEGWIAEHPPLDDLLRMDGYRVLVAELEGHVIGYSISSDETTSSRGRICKIDRVHVHHDAREIGCGDALLAAEIGRAKSRGCDLIEAEALPGDRETKNLYERAGITARMITVSKRLSDPSIEGPASR